MKSCSVGATNVGPTVQWSHAERRPNERDCGKADSTDWNDLSFVVLDSVPDSVPSESTPFTAGSESTAAIHSHHEVTLGVDRRF